MGRRPADIFHRGKFRSHEIGDRLDIIPLDDNQKVVGPREKITAGDLRETVNPFGNIIKAYVFLRSNADFNQGTDERTSLLDKVMVDHCFVFNNNPVMLIFFNGLFDRLLAFSCQLGDFLGADTCIITQYF